MGYSFWNQERKKERKKKKKKKKKKTVDSVCHPFLHRPLITQTRRRHFLGWLQFRFVFPWLIDWDNRFDSNLFLLVANGYHTTNEDSSMFWSDFNAIFLRFFFRSFVVFTGCQWLPDDRWGFEYVLTRFLRFFSNLFSFVCFFSGFYWEIFSQYHHFDFEMFLLVAYGYQTTNEDSSRLWPDFNAIFFGFLFIFFLDSIEKWSISILVLTWCFYWSPMVTERPMRIRVCCDPIFFLQRVTSWYCGSRNEKRFFLFVCFFCFFFGRVAFGRRRTRHVTLNDGTSLRWCVTRLFHQILASFTGLWTGFEFPLLAPFRRPVS